MRAKGFGAGLVLSGANLHLIVLNYILQQTAQLWHRGQFEGGGGGCGVWWGGALGVGWDAPLWSGAFTQGFCIAQQELNCLSELNFRIDFQGNRLC
jgi:hypothetical protein